MVPFWGAENSPQWPQIMSDDCTSSVPRTFSMEHLNNNATYKCALCISYFTWCFPGHEEVIVELSLVTMQLQASMTEETSTSNVLWKVFLGTQVEYGVLRNLYAKKTLRGTSVVL